MYEKYGGRVIFQQAGPEPVDAYRDFLKEKERQKAFQIYDPKLNEAFWDYFVNGGHTFYSKEEGEKSMKNPWWEMEADIKK